MDHRAQKRFVRKFLAGSMLGFLIFCAHGHSASTATVIDPGHRVTQKVRVIGHRGAAGLRPENTLAAFSKALEIGVDAIELDIQLSAEGVPVVYHDFTLNPDITRTQDGEWLNMWTIHPIKSLSLKDLKTFDVGRIKPHSSYAKRYPDQTPIDRERIPTLVEVIRLIKGGSDPSVQIWLEIKTSPEEPKVSGNPRALADTVLEILTREKIVKRMKILSFDWRVLKYVQKMNAFIPTVYLSHIGNRLNNIKPGQPGHSPWMAGLDIDDFNGSIPLAILAAGGRIWAPFYKYVTPKNLKTAQDLGMKVFVWTPDRTRDMDALIKLGVDGIITNHPDRLKTLLK